jgi:CheY-like chemotaxis protein
MAEDSPEDVFFVKESLRASGVHARIVVVSDGENAIDRILHPGEDLPALILLDAHLPKRNGVEVLRAIRSSPLSPDIPVVIFTSELSDREQSEITALGVSAYFSKSSDFKEFNRIGQLIRDLLRDRAAKAQSVED